MENVYLKSTTKTVKEPTDNPKYPSALKKQKRIGKIPKKKIDLNERDSSNQDAETCTKQIQKVDVKKNLPTGLLTRRKCQQALHFEIRTIITKIKHFEKLS